MSEEALLPVKSFGLRGYKFIIMSSEMALAVEKDRRWGHGLCFT
jgi:hypothetical protein